MLGWVLNSIVGCIGLCNVCKREMLGFQRKCCQNPNSCFCYRLSYNHPNEVIRMGIEL